MNILLVDDEIYTIRTLQAAIHWRNFGVEDVHSALNVAKAREILQACSIDLIICDIEMPKETGLDLLEWIRQQEMDTEMILLTCHTDFTYAQKAVSLGACDYCVKPVIVEEIETVIKKAIQKISEKKHVKKALAVNDLWEKNREIVDQSFWKRTLEGKNGETLPELMRLASESNITLELNDTFGLALFSAKFSGIQTNDPIKKFGPETPAYFNEEDDDIIVIENQEGVLCTVLAKNMPEDIFSERCRRYLAYMQTTMDIRLIGCFCTDVFLEELIVCYQKLLKAETAMTIYKAELWDIRKGITNAVFDVELPESLERLIYQGAFFEFEMQLEKYLQKIGWKQSVAVSALHMLRADICQALDVYLKGRNISAHTLFSDEELCMKMNDATISIEHMMQFVGRLARLAPTDADVTNITNAVKKYISLHLTGDIAREGIAQALHMNEDYISRIFKRDTGLSITQYINQDRINRARHLLGATDMSVSEIAQSVGYTNFSYFSKVFKQTVSCTPREYKLKMHKSF